MTGFVVVWLVSRYGSTGETGIGALWDNDTVRVYYDLDALDGGGEGGGTGDGEGSTGIGGRAAET